MLYLVLHHNSKTVLSISDDVKVRNLATKGNLQQTKGNLNSVATLSI